jgi:hypothetical protein
MKAIDQWLKLFRPADISGVMNFSPAIGTDVAGIFKHFINLRIAHIRGQLTNMKIAMFFRVITTPLGHFPLLRCFIMI